MAEELPAREAMEFDVVIVGAGPAGLAAAIRLKQLSPEIGVVVVEKGSEVGAHILSGAVIDPIGLDRLLPEWRSEDTPIKTAVTDDRFYWLGQSSAVRLPNFMMPPLMSNHGNFIVSLGNVCRWLATKAEALGVEIYPGFAAAEVLTENGAVVGVATGDMGIGKDGKPQAGFTRGMELRAKYTLFAEGARGSLSQDPDRALRARPGPRAAEIRHRPEGALAGRARTSTSRDWCSTASAGRSTIAPAAARSSITSTTIWCRSASSSISTTPIRICRRSRNSSASRPIRSIRDTFEGGKRLSYGARAITEGGYQSVPKLTFPGGALIGCAAGFVNVPRIKGSHNAMLSGMLAAEHVAEALSAGRANDELDDYDDAWRDCDIGRDLWKVRNAKPLWSKLGTFLGIAAGGFDMWTNTLGFSLFGTLGHGKPDAETLKPAAQYPADRLSEAGRQAHLRPAVVGVSVQHQSRGGPAGASARRRHGAADRRPSTTSTPGRRRAIARPASTNGWRRAAQPRFVINAQNCVHCKTCDIKDPNRNITWVPPEGGGGPKYSNM